MYNNRGDYLKEMGIEIKLTKEGVETLADIMSEGCPVKMFVDGYTHVSCPLFYKSTNKFTCRRCWKEWLEYFKEDDVNGSTDG